MKITLLCSDTEHPVNAYLELWMKAQVRVHEVELVRTKGQISGGDILFLISCSEIIRAGDRSKYSKTLVLHASDLPNGRGWSPHIWELIAGAEFLTLSLLEAEDKVDSGRIWHKRRIDVPRHALWHEINALLFEAEIALIDYAVSRFGQLKPENQTECAASIYHRRRQPDDSRLDVDKSIAAQFDLIRVCDPHRFPAYIEYRGHRYALTLEKIS